MNLLIYCWWWLLWEIFLSSLWLFFKNRCTSVRKCSCEFFTATNSSCLRSFVLLTITKSASKELVQFIYFLLASYGNIAIFSACLFQCSILNSEPKLAIMNFVIDVNKSVVILLMRFHVWLTCSALLVLMCLLQAIIHRIQIKSKYPQSIDVNRSGSFWFALKVRSFVDYCELEVEI